MNTDTKITYSQELQRELDKSKEALLPRPFNRLGKMWIGVLVVLCIIGLYFYVQQIREGLGITALRDYTPWGIYISNFVFFVAISLVGSLISAILKLTNSGWRTPMTRISEIIAVAAIFFAAITITIDMGRPDRFYHLFLYGRIQSPITWDVIVISIYLILSMLFLYIPMIPDMALLRDQWKGIPRWQHRMYRFLAFNWQNTPEQKQKLNRIIYTISVMIIPIAFGIHTVTSWLFATTLRPGWDSTNFGPYFVSGAFMVGAGSVIAAMYIFRRYGDLEKFFTDDHFDKMGRLLVLLSLIYFYFNLNEYFIPAYKLKGIESDHLMELLVGRYALIFWLAQIVGMIIPIVVLMFRKGRKPLPLAIMSVLVVVGAWVKRFLIVVPTLNHPYIPIQRVPESWLHYYPTIPEWFITIATLAGALLVVTVFVRYFPVVPIVETAEENLGKKDSQ